ncbi:hypothetical protein HYALB_00009235 [Hymenoscyphus albidus]|uniref:Zn(2)-C6 fungal-type domain-containing protein n=1 Tax=Hymenoscyphus albidus TaxID=595503 RepID=A0A9N9LHC4_9HELO|nr:hypothetical protein HYALB_00009235 [Hymenoscyphus albidus]
MVMNQLSQIPACRNSNMATPQVRRRRQCGPKTRTGCQTCKIRRIKCDEAKPSCKRCTSTGRTCDGYQEIPTSFTKSGNPNTLAQRISSTIPGSTQEKRGFSYFINQTSPELNGFYANGFWDALLLQASHGEPSLRHTVIAISTLHEEFTRKREERGVAESLAFALNQYTKALGHLRRSLASGKQAPLTALMSCLLFVCFDSLRGFYRTAMVHLRSGMKILADFRKNKIEDPMIEELIAPLLLRLGVQSILYIDTSLPRDRVAFARELTKIVPPRKSLPESFSTLEEARSAINECADGLFRTFYLSNGDLPMISQSPETFELHTTYPARLHEWNLAFEKFMNAHSSTFTSKQVRGAALLKIHHTVVRIMSDMTPPNTDHRPISEALNCPQSFERFTADFQIVVNLCRSLITAAEQDAKNGKPALTFSTDLGVIGPLYYAAVKCTSQRLKREAVDLLKRCPRKEGMWDSATAVNIVEQLWKMQEKQRRLQGLRSREGSPDVPLQEGNEWVDLIFYEGGDWQWIWKESDGLGPGIRLNRSVTPVLGGSC